MKVVVTNIVISSNCKCKLDIKTIYHFERFYFKDLYIKFDESKFPAIIVYLPKGTALVFNSGYYSIAGLKDFKSIKIAQKQIIDLLNKHGFDGKMFNAKILNVCGSLDLNTMINLHYIDKYMKNASFESELFIAAKIPFKNHIYTLHHNGKLFTTGFKTIKEMKRDLFSFKTTLFDSLRVNHTKKG